MHKTKQTQWRADDGSLLLESTNRKDEIWVRSQTLNADGLLELRDAIDDALDTITASKAHRETQQILKAAVNN